VLGLGQELTVQGGLNKQGRFIKKKTHQGRKQLELGQTDAGQYKNNWNQQLHLAQGAAGLPQSSHTSGQKPQIDKTSNGPDQEAQANSPSENEAHHRNGKSCRDGGGQQQTLLEPLKIPNAIGRTNP
jgi:hypothetical protein